MRYHGTGRRKPILLLAHTDVVEAKREDWSMDPFTLIEKDGYFYGRGIGDDKAQAAIWIANLIRYKREGFKPDRDIIVALTADEEGGGPYNGVEWLLKNKRDLIDAELCLNEGGWGESVAGTRSRTTCRSARSTSSTTVSRCTTRAGTARCRSPTTRSIISPARSTGCRNSRFPLKTNDVTRAYFRAMAEHREGADERGSRRGCRWRHGGHAPRRRGDDGVERYASHDVRRDAARGWAREERAAPARRGECELPSAARRSARTT